MKNELTKLHDSIFRDFSMNFLYKKEFFEEIAECICNNMDRSGFLKIFLKTSGYNLKSDLREFGIFSAEFIEQKRVSSKSFGILKDDIKQQLIAGFKPIFFELLFCESHTKQRWYVLIKDNQIKYTIQL